MTRTPSWDGYIKFKLRGERGRVTQRQRRRFGIRACDAEAQSEVIGYVFGGGDTGETNQRFELFFLVNLEG